MNLEEEKVFRIYIPVGRARVSTGCGESGRRRMGSFSIRKPGLRGSAAGAWQRRAAGEEEAAPLLGPGRAGVG